MRQKPQWFIGEMTTGLRTRNLQPVSGDWSTPLTGTGSLQCTIDMKSAAVRALNLSTSAEEYRYYLAIAKNGYIRQAGPITAHAYDDDEQTLNLKAGSLNAYWAKRIQIAYPTVNLATDVFSVVGSYGLIAKRILQNAMMFPGGSIPMILPDDELGGIFERNYPNTGLSKINDLLNNLSNVIGGPDILFRPEFTSDGLGILWRMITGTLTDDEIHGDANAEQVFDLSAPKSTILSLSVDRDGENLNDITYTLGAATSQDADAPALMVLSESTGLRDRGLPLLQDSISASGVSVPATAIGYSQRNVQYGQMPVNTWSMKVRANQSPRIDTYNEGDYIHVRIGYNHPYVPQGEYRMRILQKASDITEEEVTLSIAPDRTPPAVDDQAA